MSSWIAEIQKLLLAVAIVTLVVSALIAALNVFSEKAILNLQDASSLLTYYKWA